MNVSLNALDNMGSLLWASNNGGASQGFAYSTFGSTPARSADNSMLPGFNGERLDPVSQTYHLGNGYRTYNPVLMRFNAPDSWSPFGSGGLNQYAYCEGDPINRSDPSGHMSGGAIAGIILGTLGMVLSAIVTCGSSIPATIAAGVAWSAAEVAQAITTGLGVAADVSGIVSGATQESDPKLSQDFGWASMAFGIASFATGSVDAIHGKVTGRSASYDLLDDSYNLSDDGSGGHLPPVSEPDEGARVVNVGDKSFRISPPESGPRTRKGIVVSHGGFQPLQQYLTGTANVEIPEGLKVAHCVRHGENVSTRQVSELMHRLGRGEDVPSIKNYQGRRRFKNYILAPDPRSNSVYTSREFDVIRPVGRMHMRDVFDGVHSGVLPYDEIYFIFCRGCHL